MIPWNRTPPPQAPDATITIGSAQLSVREHRGDIDIRWQYLVISLGEFNTAPLDECLETWPTRAIKLARQAVNELDRKLKALAVAAKAAESEIVAGEIASETAYPNGCWPDRENRL